MNYFLVVSFSCLPIMTEQLNNLKSGERAFVLCFSQPIYDFLSILSKRHSYISLQYVDVSKIVNQSIRFPWKIWSIRKELNNLTLSLFQDKGQDCTIYFYNHHFAMYIFYFVWQFRSKCRIVFAISDPSQIDQLATGPIASLKKFILTMIYPFPFDLYENKGAKQKFYPGINQNFFTTLQNLTDYSRDGDLRVENPIASSLMFKSNAELLWIMGLTLDLGEVDVNQYFSALKELYSAVNNQFPPETQAIKYHPRARQKETFFQSGVEIIPAYIPAEFLELPDLKAVITVSSASILRIPLNVTVISLVNLLPFRNEDIRNRHLRVFEHFSTGLLRVVPKSMAELRACISSTPA